MKPLHQFLATSLTLTLLITVSSGQRNEGTGPRPPQGPITEFGGPGGAGGTNNGPGDTVGPGGNNGNGASPGTRSGPVSLPSALTPGGSPYAAGANPLARPFFLPGVDDPTNPNARTSAPISPTSRPEITALNSWRLWWHYNRWNFLAASKGPASSGADTFYTGRGTVVETNPFLTVSQAQMQDIVQPALLKVLDRGGRPELEIFALHALAKLRSVVPDETRGGFEHIVQSFMRSGNQDVAEKSVLALGIRGDDRFFPWLSAILADTPDGRSLLGRQDVSVRLRTFAAYGLGLLGERTHDPKIQASIFDSLTEALWIDRVEVQAACLMSLGLTPMPMKSELPEGDTIFEGRTRAAQVLGLITFFEDGDQSFVARSQAPAAVARLMKDVPDSLRGRAAYTFLTASAQHSKELKEVQNAAVIALGQVGRSGADPIDTQIREHLERVAYQSSADRSTRYFAITALAEASARAGAGDEPYAGVAGTRKLLLKRLGRARGELKAWTGLGLGILERNAAERGERATPAVTRALRDTFKRSRSNEVSGAIAIALGMIRDLEAVELLRERMLESGEENMRAYSCLALGMIGNPAVTEDLRRVLAVSTNKPVVIENAAIALALLGDQEIGPRLFKLLGKSPRPKVQASIASALGWIRDPRPLGRLCESMLDPRKNDTGRAWTAVAVGRICDNDDWPWGGRLAHNAQYDVVLPTLYEPRIQNGLLDLP